MRYNKWKVVEILTGQRRKVQNGIGKIDTFFRSKFAAFWAGTGNTDRQVIFFDSDNFTSYFPVIKPDGMTYFDLIKDFRDRT
jgi:hypothetical protein